MIRSDWSIMWRAGARPRTDLVDLPYEFTQLHMATDLEQGH
jgi:hypothetical protein